MPKPSSSVLALFKKTANPSKVDTAKLKNVDNFDDEASEASEEIFSEYTEEEEEYDEYVDDGDYDEDDMDLPNMDGNPPAPPTPRNNNTPKNNAGSVNQMPGSVSQMPGSVSQIPGSVSQMPGSASEMPGSASCMNSVDAMTAKKQFYLAEISRMNYALATRVSMSDTLQHLEFMYNQCRNTADANSTVEFMKEGLRMVCVGVETANEKFGPFLKLKGWSRAVTSDMRKFQHPLEEIYRRYWRRGGVSPFLELGMALGSSVMQYHFTGGYGSGNPPESDMKFDSFSVANSHMGSMRGPANF